MNVLFFDQDLNDCHYTNFLSVFLKQRFWSNTFSSSGNNNCICLFPVAWDSTGNTIVSTHRFFLDSDTGIKPGLFRKWERENISLAMWVWRTVRSLSALAARDEGSQCLSPTFQLTPKPPVPGYAGGDLSPSCSVLLSMETFVSTWVYVDSLNFSLCLANGTAEASFPFLCWQIESGSSYNKGGL